QFVNRLSEIQRPTLPTPDGVSLSLTERLPETADESRLGRGFWNMKEICVSKQPFILDNIQRVTVVYDEFEINRLAG
ncbi:hypothetical protein ACCS45_34035, partial [Rhizobium ruizarguesonis]